VSISRSYVTFPRRGTLSDVVDMVVTTDDEIHTVLILNVLFVGHSSESVCQVDVLLSAHHIPSKDVTHIGHSAMC
jgi:hypothetical protein